MPYTSENRGSIVQGSPQQRIQDQFHINLQQEWQRRWWSHELGVTEEQLAAAVEKAGPRSKAVREHLARVERK
jgi:hypothetical protein